MPDFKPTEDIISMSEFRTTLADCVARTKETHRPIILTQNVRASSVFLDATDWEKIADALATAESLLNIPNSSREAFPSADRPDLRKVLCKNRNWTTQSA